MTPWVAKSLLFSSARRTGLGKVLKTCASLHMLAKEPPLAQASTAEHLMDTTLIKETFPLKTAPQTSNPEMISQSQESMSSITPPSIISLMPPQIQPQDTPIESSAYWEYVLQGSALWPSNLIERAMEICHWLTGLPWGLNIVAFTIGLRACLFPFSVMQTRSAMMAHNCKQHVQRLQSEAQILRERGAVDAGREKLRELASYMSANGINPIRILALSVLPLPFFMSCFFALRNMSKQPVLGLLDQGLFWFSNLTLPDPYYILPAITTATLFASLELSKYSTPNANMSSGMKLGLRIFALASLPITALMPSALVLYFLTSNLFTVGTHLLWRSAAVRNLFKVPAVTIQSVPEIKQSFTELFKETYKAHLHDAQTAHTQYTDAKAVLSSPPPRILPQKPNK